jgi:tripartite-type tricarboxylate transporter receptor subunit TctC
MQESSGVSVVVENRTGGGRTVAPEAVARATPDGTTLFMGSHGPNVILPLLSAKLPYDAEKDFAPVVHIATLPNILVVHPSVPAKSVKDLVALAKASPGKLTFASQGNGSSGHMAGELLKLKAGLDLIHVPYRGAAPAAKDLVAGHVNMLFDTISNQAPAITAGTARALVVTSAQRVEMVKDVPTAAEAGFPDLEMSAWFGLFAPAGTPKEAIDWIYAETRKAFAAPEMRARFTVQGALLPLGSPEAFAAHVAAERTRWGEVIRSAGIKLE